MSFPVFDLAAFERSDADGKRQMGREVDLICRASGFLAVQNHGIPDDVISAVWQAARDFFDLAPEAKDRVRAPYPGYPYG
ncbi:2-oxoglutarate and iron-dependent oxygenase domain-containing protein [Rhizobium sp.]